MTTLSHQFELARTVRVPATALEHRPDAGTTNGLLGVPGPEGVGAVAEIEVACTGLPAASGYLVDIGLIDRVVRRAGAPLLAAAIRDEVRTGRPADMAALLSELAGAIASELPALLARLTYAPAWTRHGPLRGITLEFTRTTAPAAGEAAMPANANPPRASALVLTETYEFAASHRLHLAQESDEANRALFGKCNNPNGHGHNYRIEVAAEVAVAADGGGLGRFGFAALGRAVEEEVMRRFDHRNLNLDCPEFATLNPSVEHIAMVCHGLLAPRLAREGATLRFVRVWETDKTSCRYPA